MKKTDTFLPGFLVSCLIFAAAGAQGYAGAAAASSVSPMTPSDAPADTAHPGAGGSRDQHPMRGTGRAIHHALRVDIDPASHRIQVEDTVTLPPDLAAELGDRGYFVLHEGLKVTRRGQGARIKPVKRAAHDLPEAFADMLSRSEASGPPLRRLAYHLTTPSPTFTVRYEGTIAHPVEETGESYARDFRETTGTIEEDGIYLAGSTHWLPWFGDRLVTFDLEVILPSGWKAVTQGERTEQVDDGTTSRSTWRCAHPQDQVYLVAGRWTEYARTGGVVTAMAFLRQPDEGLANRYLDATERYVQMYDDLLGPYPYGKFALVENFWETGYGMPSFTLLGPRIIRFPFILTSSYPHEILHNWWGNGVYVDYSAGNWCEGLTAYLADHLIQAQRGAAATYRETTLQKYSDYAARGKDFPLTEFRERHSATTEAVGYGKALMVFHMLRLELGNETFVQGLRRFYADNRFQEASWKDLETAFESVSGRSLERFFSQWVTWTGAPSLVLDDVTADPAPDGPADGGYRLQLTLSQVQDGPAYYLRIPVAITVADRREAIVETVTMDHKRQRMTLKVAGRPLRVDVDPTRDVFRVLDRDETPPALSGVFGAEHITLLLPSKADPRLLDAYRRLAETWMAGTSGHLEIRLDSDDDTFPDDPGVWVLGWENRWRAKAMAGLQRYDITMTETTTRIGRTEIPRADHALVVVSRTPNHPNQMVAFIGADLPEALPGLTRKLPHYHKYSFLGFEGAEPANMAKGRWPVLDSPLTRVLARHDDTEGSPAAGDSRSSSSAPGAFVSPGRLPKRPPLVEPPPMFSARRMLHTVARLAAPAYKGRGLGTPELDQAAADIAKAFEQAGLQPAGDEPGRYYQIVPWPEDGIEGLDADAKPMKNVVGVIPGRNPNLAGESVVVGAHYDHLGMGEIGGRDADRGQIHPGADDNASGVAVLLELARVLGDSLAPDRTVIFVAFTGEEEGRLGSRYFVETTSPWPKEKMIGMINIDTVGRLEGRRLMVLGTGSAREWVHIFMGVGYTTGVQTECVSRDLDSSDQKSFQAAGVPAVQLFSGPHLDYHRPTDTADKIDPAGLVQAATVVKEVVEYLASREGPLTVRLNAAAPAPGASHGMRKVSLGTVPDFAYEGTGVRLSGVVPGSPAEAAGLKPGDVIVQIGETAITDLRAFSELLKTLEPGDVIVILFDRDGQRQEVRARVVAR